MKFVQLFFLVFFMLLSVLPYSALASSHGSGSTGGERPVSITLQNPLRCLPSGTLADCVNNAINALIFIAAPIASIMVLIGGFQMMFAAGEPEKIARGRKTILYAAVGFAVIIMAKGVVVVLRSIFR